MKKKLITFATILLPFVLIMGTVRVCAETITSEELPIELRHAIQSIEFDRMGDAQIKTAVEFCNKNMARITFEFNLTDTLRHDDWQVQIEVEGHSDFNWANHLSPTPDNIIDQHVFRTPAMITQQGQRTLIFIPDVDLIAENQQSRWYMDFDAPANTYIFGMSNSAVTDHVLFSRAPGAKYSPGKMRFGFYVLFFNDKQTQYNPFRPILSFFWDRWGKSEYEKLDLSPSLFMKYSERTYDWAFGSWKNVVWQQFKVEGHQVGAPVFIVNVTQSPNYPGRISEREFRSVWNQAWFNSLRSASGLYRYARITGNDSLMDKARMTKELALCFPQKDGFFWGLIGTPMESVEVDGQQYNQSKGWKHYFWGNSNRNPFEHEPDKAPFHILDMSWTAFQMLAWYTDLEKDARLLEYAIRYADALLDIQTQEGFFPAWIDTQTLKPYEILTTSPETSMSVNFLLCLYEITKQEKYRVSALKAMNVVIRDIIPQGRWEDFETYWSCCHIGTPEWIGKKVLRNNMYKQCNFSMYWTADALLKCYQLTGQRHYLTMGERTLDELLMTQASWQPPYIYVDAIGGFGVMNTDGEWNDARQSLFATLIFDYSSILKRDEYRQRALAAMKASFAMMYCPENPKAMVQWEKRWPFFGEQDYGFMMENYGHSGHTSPDGVGIGEFTIYDWGNGAASEAWIRAYDRYGDTLFDKSLTN